MRKLVAIAVVILAVSLCAVAQDVPKVEVFGGYSVAHIGSDFVNGAASQVQSAVPGATLSTTQWVKKGFDGSVTYNFNKYLGFESDFRYYSGDVITGSFAGVSGAGNIRDITFMFGPRVALRNKSKLTPFAHVLFGGNDLQGTISATGVASQSTSDTGFSMALGGGLDVPVSRALAIRLIQADYVRTSAFSTSSNNLALSFGVVLNLGSVSGRKK